MGCGASLPASPGVRVIILGGGFAGTAVLRELAGLVSLTLVEPQDRFYNRVASPRALAVEGWEGNIFVPYDALLAGKVPGGAAARHVRGAATAVDPAARTVSVSLLDGRVETLPYDILVVALGSLHGAPATPLSVHSGTSMAALAALRAAVRGAAVVAVVGGGPVGVDFAGEIATELPGREVHLIARAPVLLPHPAALRAEMRTAVADALRGLGVRLHLGTSASAPAAPLPAGVQALDGGRVLLGKHALALSDGTTLQPDVTLFATGGAPNAAPLRSGPLGELLSDKGRLLVRRTLQVEGHPEIFAAGDIADADPNLLAYVAGEQGPVVARNVALLAAAIAAGSDRAAPAFGEYAPSKGATLVVTAGRNFGAAQINGSPLPGFIIRWMKGGDLLAGKTTASLGYAKAGVFPGAQPPSFEPPKPAAQQA